MGIPVGMRVETSLYDQWFSRYQNQPFSPFLANIVIFSRFCSAKCFLKKIYNRKSYVNVRKRHFSTICNQHLGRYQNWPFSQNLAIFGENDQKPDCATDHSSNSLVQIYDFWRETERTSNCIRNHS